MNPATTPIQTEFRDWIDSIWSALEAGRDVVIPDSFHPDVQTWPKPPLSEPHGQTDDRVAVVRPDGSRVHARQWDRETWTIHRDRWNPDASPLHLGLHLGTETIAGRVVTGLIMSAIVGYIVRGTWTR